MVALTRATLADAAAELCARDADLAAVLARCGPLPSWSRPRGFATLVYIILEQQVSLASGRAAYDKLCALLPEFSPRAYLRLSDRELRAAGVSRQKTRYTRLLAEAILDGSLPMTTLGRKPDEEVRRLLTAITGVGDWTADVYMMAALRRPDLWPVGDLALVKSIQSMKGLDQRPDRDWLQQLGERYRPYRSVATRIYWHHYLNPE